jgi:hypothetical protein
MSDDYGYNPFCFLTTKHTPFTFRAPKKSSPSGQKRKSPKRILTPIKPSKFEGYRYPYDQPPKDTDTIFRL